MNTKKFYRAYFLFICILIVFLSLLLGFLVSNIFDLMKNSYESLGNAIVTVLVNPFGCHFNFYTPIFGIILFAIFQFVIFILYFKASNKEWGNNENIKIEVLNNNCKSNKESTIFDETDKEKEDVCEEESESVFDDDEDIFSSMLDAVDIENINTEDDFFYSESISLDVESVIENNDSSDDSNDDELFFSPDTMDELTIMGFDMLQIRSMLKIKRYIEDINASFLGKIFNPDMTPDEIENYIELFYE